MTLGFPRKFGISVRLALAVLLASVCVANADDKETPNRGLPGVAHNAADETRIKPSGEPLEDLPASDDNGFVRVGDWDVKISGNITIDIGTTGTFVPRSGR